MKKSILTSLILTLAAATPAAAKIVNLRCEYLVNPIGIDTTAPRLTWQSDNDVTATAYSVQLDDTPRFTHPITFDAQDSWSCVAHIDTIPGKKYYWRVVEHTGGKTHRSETARFETGRFSPHQWTAKWISDNHDVNFEPAPMFRSTFNIDKNHREARAYISALGYYTLYINGQRVSDHHMDPGFTGYDKRSLYVTHDVTDMLRKGENTIEVTLGNGFANCQSRDAWGQEKAPWRSRPSFICEIVADGATVASTDDSWLTATGPVIYNNLYSGEHYDARINPTGWHNALIVDAPNDRLVAQTMPAIRPVDTFEGRLIHSSGDTVFVFDMGRNIAGVSELTVKGTKGTRLEIAHGELLKDNGRLELGNLNIYYHPLKADENFQTDVYIIGNDGREEVYHPEYTYHGFRYAEVRSDKPVAPSDISLKGLMMRTAVDRVGHFRCSDSLLNRIYDATMLSYEDNIHSIPTDCPQREKNGWTADAHVAIDLALLNYDGITLYEKWMNDFADNQRPNGNVAGIVPSAGWGYGDSPGPVWDAALFVIPVALYDYYGDATAIKRLYPSMLCYMDWLKSLRKDDGTLACGIGDWLPYKTQTPTDFTSTLYAYADYKMMTRICEILGEDPAVWRQEAEDMKQRINDKWFDQDKALYANGSQAAQAIALYWGIVPEGYDTLVARNLNDMVVANDCALDFGLLGSKSVLRMLTRYDYGDTAIKMATRTQAPSWGHWIEECGYTTLAETWTLSPEFRDASLNHSFFGDIAAWMTNDIAGLNYDSTRPGFANIIIRPHFFKGIDWAEASYQSVKGLITTRWQRLDNGKIELSVDIPAGCTASLMVDGTTIAVASGHHRYIL